MGPTICPQLSTSDLFCEANRDMNAFGDRIRRLRKAKGYSLRKLAPIVGVGFSYLSKVENGRLDFRGPPSESLIHRLAESLEADEDELLLLAGRIPDSIALRILEQPEAFRVLAQCGHTRLQQLAASVDPASKSKRPRKD